MKKFTKEELINSVTDALRKTHVYKNLGFKSVSGTTANKIKQQFVDNGIDLDDLIRKNIYVNKVCPVCDKEYEVSIQMEKSRPKLTCSYGCANTYFRSGINNGSHAKAINAVKTDVDDSDSDTKISSGSYRTICFHYHEKKCVVCSESKIVAVHHYDENHYNNVPENLIPMCPTHHQYMHSKFKDEVSGVVDDYIKQWKDKNKGI